jgi:hypothetical protein
VLAAVLIVVAATLAAASCVHSAHPLSVPG